MLLEGKRGLVLGIANKRSIAWGIAQAVSREGARLAVTYQGERLEENVRGAGRSAQGPADPALRRGQGRGPQGAGRRRARASSAGSTSWSTPWPSRCARSSTASSSTPRARATGSPRTSRPTRSPRSRAATAPLMDERRQHRHPQLPGRRARGAALQRHGRGQGRARDVGALPRLRPRARRASASTPSPPARSRRWPPPAFTASRRCSSTTAPTRRCARTPSRRRWATPRSSWSPRSSRGVTGEVIHVDGGLPRDGHGGPLRPTAARRRARAAGRSRSRAGRAAAGRSAPLVPRTPPEPRQPAAAARLEPRRRRRRRRRSRRPRPDEPAASAQAEPRTRARCACAPSRTSRWPRATSRRAGFVDLNVGRHAHPGRQGSTIHEATQPDGKQGHRVVAEGNVVFMRGEERLAGEHARDGPDTGRGFSRTRAGYVAARRLRRGASGSSASTTRPTGSRAARFTSCTQPNPRWGFQRARPRSRSTTRSRPRTRSSR